MIEVTNVTKTHGGITSADQVSFTAEAGVVTGLLGPNGAGKTTVVFLSVQIHQVNGRPIALENFLNQVLLNEFNHPGVNGRVSPVTNLYGYQVPSSIPVPRLLYNSFGSN